MSVVFKVNDDDDGVDDNLTSIDVVAGMTYFIKKADWRAFFVADSTETITFSASLSNYGKLNIVPLPAAGWMLLAGVGGLAAAKRRRKS